MACKNSINWQCAKIPRVLRVLGVYLTTKPQIVGWAVPGKRHKIFVEVRLIVVKGLVRDPRPIDRPCRVKTVESVLKSVKTRYLFRRPADQSLKMRAQVVLANADMVTQRPNCHRTVISADLSQSILNQI